MIKEQTRGRTWVPRQNSKKGTKQKMLFAITQDTQRISDQKWLDRRNNESLGVLGCHDHTDHAIKEEKERCRQIYVPKQKTVAYTREYKKLLYWVPSTDSRKITAADPSAPLDFPKPRTSSKALAFDHKKLPTVVGLTEIPSEKGVWQWLVSVKPRPMARIFVAIQVQFVWRKKHRPRKTAIFQKPTGAINSTPSTTELFQHLRTPTHMRSRTRYFSCVVQASKVQGYPSLASVDTFMHYTDTMNTGTTLVSDDEQATVTNCKNPSTHTLKKQVLAFCRSSLSFTQYFNCFLHSPLFLNVPCFRPTSIGQLMCQPMPRIPWAPTTPNQDIAFGCHNPHDIVPSHLCLTSFSEL